MKLTEEKMNEVMEMFTKDYIEIKKIEEYLDERFENSEYYYGYSLNGGKWVEVFIDDHYIDDSIYEGYFFMHEALLELVNDSVLKMYEGTLELGGEDTSWIIDRLLESKIYIYKKSEMIKQ